MQGEKLSNSVPANGVIFVLPSWLVAKSGTTILSTPSQASHGEKAINLQGKGSGGGHGEEGQSMGRSLTCYV